MSDQNGQARTAEERHAKFLEKHKERMQKVDKTVAAVKARGRRAVRSSEKQAGA